MLNSQISPGSFLVYTSNNGGHTPDTLAEMCVNKLIHVSDTAPPELRAQALAFRQHMLKVVRDYITIAVQQDRMTVAEKIRKAGYPDIAEQVKGV